MMTKEPVQFYKEGDNMGTFMLSTEDGLRISIPMNKWCVLYFYPKDDTPGCTTQALAFSELIQEYNQEGVIIFGVNTDSVESHFRFKKKHNLKVNLLSDPRGDVARAFGVELSEGQCSRDLAVLNPEGKIMQISRGVDPQGSPAKAIEFIRQQKSLI